MTNSRITFLRETAATKARFERLLAEIVRAQGECEAQMSKLSRTDPYKSVTGRSAMDNAVASTRRMIEALERTIEQARRELNDDDMALLDELTDTRG